MSNRKARRAKQQTTLAVKASGIVGYSYNGGQLHAIKTNDPISGGGWVVPGYRNADLRDDEGGYATAYQTCVWAARGIDVVASKIAEVLHRGKVKDAQGNEVTNNPLKRALDLAYITWRKDIYKAWAVNKWTFGEAYTELVCNQWHIPTALKSILNLGIEPYYPYGDIEWFDYQTPQGQVKRLRLDDVVYDTFPRVDDDIRGESKLAAALASVDIDRSVVITTKSYLKNNMRPGVIFTPRDTRVNETDKANILNTIREQGKGAQNAARPLFIDFPMDVTTVAPPTFEDQAYINENQMERICAAVGVPVALVNYNNQKFQLGAEQRKGFYTETVLPQAGEIARLIDAIILPFLAPNSGYTYEIDIESELDKLDDAQAKTDRVTKQFTSGGLTFNQMVTAFGNEPVAGGDWYAIPSGIIPVPAAQMAQVSEIVAQTTQNTPSPSRPAFGGMAAATVNTPPTPLLPATTKEGMKSAAVMLGIGAQPDLVGLQNTVKQYCAASNIQAEWENPSDFHITLLSAPALNDEQLVALRTFVMGMEVDPLALTIGSLGTFDSLDSYAIRFMLRRSSDLLDLHQQLFDYCEQNDIPVSQYSQPLAYKPHITMGYASTKPRGLTFNSKLTVTPQRIQLGVDKAIAYERPIVMQARKGVDVDETLIDDVLTPMQTDESIKKGTFEESKHPRADDGQFGAGSGGSSGDTPKESDNQGSDETLDDAKSRHEKETKELNDKHATQNAEVNSLRQKRKEIETRVKEEASSTYKEKEAQYQEKLTSLNQKHRDEMQSLPLAERNPFSATGKRQAQEKIELSKERPQTPAMAVLSNKELSDIDAKIRDIPKNQPQERNSLITRQRNEIEPLQQREQVKLAQPAKEPVKSNGVEVGKADKWDDKSVGGISNEDLQKRTGYSHGDVLGAAGFAEVDPGRFGQASVNPYFDKDGKLDKVKISVGSHGESLDMERTLHFKDGKPDYISNDHFYLSGDEQGNGLGTRILYSQTQTAKQMGFSKVKTVGGKSNTMNGYYTWARLGYDGDITGRDGKPTRLSSVMKTQSGRDWWKENGKQMEMEFDLSDGSISNQVLETYTKKKFGGA